MIVDKLKASRLIAHRGASAYAPENTYVAMHKANAMGASWVEFDVMLAGCGDAIIIHDDTLDRTTNGTGEVAKTPHSQIIQLDAGSWFHADFANERVPTMIDLLRYLDDIRMDINVEIKPTPGNDVRTAEATVKRLNQYWNLKDNPPLISSQSIECLRTVRHLEPDWHLCCVIHHWDEDWYSWIHEFGCIAVSVNHEILVPELLRGLKTFVPLVLAYTVNDAKRAMELYSMGIDAVFSDYPDLLVF